MSAPTAAADPEAYAGEVERLAALAAAVRRAEAHLYGAVREARSESTGRPVITRADVAAAVGLPESTIFDRVASYEARLGSETA